MGSASTAKDTIGSAVAAALGALVGDKDTSQVDVVEGGLPEVVRRGRRERLSALVEGPLFEVLREAGAATSLLQLVLPGSILLVAGPLADGRVALSLRRAAPTDASLVHLVEEGVVPAGVDAELVGAVFLGQGLTVLGPARAIRSRLAVAVAVAVSTRLRVVALGSDVPARVLPAPLGDDVVARARAGVALGADVLFALDLAPAQLAALLTWPLPVPLIATVSSSSMEGLVASLAAASRALLGLTAVCAFDLEGRPRLVELHGEPSSSPSSSPPSPSPSSSPPSPSPSSSPPSPSPSSAMQPSSSSPRRAPSAFPDDAPIHLEAPPADWASEDIDDDPGWELGPVGASTSATSSPPQPGSFDAALQAAAKRPTFSPKAPPVHPQAAALRGTGGLTFEPPGGRGDDDGGGL